MKLYYGGCGPHKAFVVAEDANKAAVAIGIKINAPFLPVTLDEISEVDGFEIRPVSESEPAIAITTFDEVVTEADEVVEGGKPASLRHCKHCDFTCESQGELMRHYKECHPKGA